jgi:integrase
MSDRPYDSWRARAAVSEALDVFNSGYMQEVWTKALARRETDPEAAVTSARTLLESLCKHILDAADQGYREGASLPELYRATAKVLDIAPTEELGPIFSTLFSSCAEIVKSVGILRNHLSDSHGRGPFGTMPDWRHAELAVNLSGAMATYLAAVWKGRQPTVRDVIERVVADTDRTKPLGLTHRYALVRLTREPIIADIIASKLQVGDLIALCEERLSKGALPQTINQDITYLRGALGDPLGEIFDEAMVALREMKLIAKSESRTRRTNHEEFDALIGYFRGQDKHRAKIPMEEIMEFAVWSGLPISKICSLRWEDVDFDKHTCKLPNRKEPIPLLEKAWDIVEIRHSRDSSNKDKCIFPYRAKSAGASHTRAKKELSKTIPAMADSRFNDLRYEAINRLLEKGHPPHIVARATSTAVTKVMEIYERVRKEP